MNKHVVRKIHFEICAKFLDKLALNLHYHDSTMVRSLLIHPVVHKHFQLQKNPKSQYNCKTN